MASLAVAVTVEVVAMEKSKEGPPCGPVHHCLRLIQPMGLVSGMASW